MTENICREILDTPEQLGRSNGKQRLTWLTLRDTNAAVSRRRWEVRSQGSPALAAWPETSLTIGILELLKEPL